jgi:hypothetical protein
LTPDYQQNNEALRFRLMHGINRFRLVHESLRVDFTALSEIGREAVSTLLFVDADLFPALDIVPLSGLRFVVEQNLSIAEIFAEAAHQLTKVVAASCSCKLPRI